MNLIPNCIQCICIVGWIDFLRFVPQPSLSQSESRLHTKTTRRLEKHVRASRSFGSGSDHLLTRTILIMAYIELQYVLTSHCNSPSSAGRREGSSSFFKGTRAVVHFDKFHAYCRLVSGRSRAILGNIQNL